LFLYSPRLRGWEYRESLFEDEDFHRQMKEPGFRDYHLLLDEQDKQILAIGDDVGARAQHWRNTQEQRLRIRSAQ
jgi:DNA-binding ferritin-like protein